MFQPGVSLSRLRSRTLSAFQSSAYANRRALSEEQRSAEERRAARCAWSAAANARGSKGAGPAAWWRLVAEGSVRRQVHVTQDIAAAEISGR